MFGTVLLDIAIGLTFLYLSLSLVGSALAEFVELLLRARAQTLEKGIRNLLFDEKGKDFALKIYKHPLIQGLAKLPVSKIEGVVETTAIKRRWLPSYIPANLFVTALLDIIAREKTNGAAAGLDMKTIKEALSTLTAHTEVKKALVALLPASAQQAAQDAGKELSEFRANLESWYDGAMDRVSGWFKRHTQLVLLLIGFFMAVAFNADTIMAVRELARDRVLRESLVAAAQQYVRAQPPTQASATETSGSGKEVTPEALSTKLDEVQGAIKNVKGLGLPIGWTDEQRKSLSSAVCFETKDPVTSETKGTWDNWLILLSKLLGWFLTAIAVTLGAPFWFDLLNRFVVVRSTIKPQEKSPP